MSLVGFRQSMAGSEQSTRISTRDAVDSWLDSRCQPYLEEIDRHFADRVTALTGCPPTCNHGPKMLWWANERPADYARIVKFVTPSSYVAAGRQVACERSIYRSHFFALYIRSDAANGNWSEELCNALGIDAKRLPRIVEPWTVIGELSSEAASDFGLKSGTPVQRAAVTRLRSAGGWRSASGNAARHSRNGLGAGLLY